MSRRPTTSKVGLSRTASAASMAMPPPRVPTRPPSAMSVSASSSAINRPDDIVAPSPRKSSASKRTVNGNGSSVNGKGKAESEGSGEINIQVVVRCRGRSPQELAQTSPIITTTSGPLSKAITIETTPMATSSLATFTTASSYGGSHAPSTKTYPFDKVFGPEADQNMVFDEVAEGMLDEVLSGYNCTIFAYGQTGTGKTYTMQGDLELSPLSAPKDSAGIVPRVLHRLFALLNAAENTEFSVKCSYVELYNEELRDLLSSDYNSAGSTSHSGNGGGLKLYEDGKKGTMIQGLEEVGVKSLQEALAVVNKGCQKRQVAETKMNTESSRSHTILSITVHVKETGVASHGEDLLKVGKFNLVDLAGSEAIGRSGATDKRAREAGMINQSLLTLGRVISALVEKGPHIPYRESKLTRLLQDSLGGRTKTCIVATVSPTRSNMEETLSTLDYAIRAKSIRNRPELNQHLTKTGLLKEYLGDIERLKAEVLAAREKNGIYIPEDQWREMQDDLAKQKSEYEEAKLRASSATVELATKKKMFDDLSTKMLVTTADLESAREAERQLGALLEEIKVELEENRVRLEEERVVAEAYQRGEERLNGVATGLKDLATESVSDVGGLFDKLARKAGVLGSNADAATRFGADLQSLSTDLRNGLNKMQSVQGELGRQLESEMFVHAKKGQEISQRDMAALDTSFRAFDGLARSLTSSLEAGHVDAAAATQAMLRVKEEVQTSVRDWARALSERNTAMVEDLLGHQQEHLSMVGSVLDSTTDLVDAVISTAREHVMAESQAAARSRQSGQDTANAEMARLRAQNALLSKMLSDEKQKTAKLRTELVENLTQMIVGFTDAQDQSWSSAVEQVQLANITGIEEMDNFARTVETDYASVRRRTEEIGEELGLASSTVMRQREAGQSSLGDVRAGVHSRLEHFGQESMAEVKERAQSVDRLCEDLAGGISGLSSTLESNYQQHSQLVQSISSGVSQTHETSMARTGQMCDDIASLTSTLLETHASTSKSFEKSHVATAKTLSSLMGRTSHFLSEEIQEDVPTGVTPRKKAWNVPISWDRTEPRDVLIAQIRAGARPPSALGSLNSASSTGAEPLLIEAESTASVTRTNSTVSITSTSTTSASHEEAHGQQAMSREPTPLASIPINGLASSQMRIPSKGRIPSGMNGKKGGAGPDEGLVKVPMSVLGEGGNIPRKVRR